MSKNSLKKIRESLMVSTSELSKKANVFPMTITGIEKGFTCRFETKKKIIKALGYKLSDRENNLYWAEIRNRKGVRHKAITP